MFDASPIQFTPLAPAESQIVQGNQRITILASGLIRFEQSDDGVFEDRASTFAVNRALPTPKYDLIRKDGGAMEIITDRVYIQWSGKAFGPSSLLVSLRDKGGDNMGWTHVWRWGDTSNYKSTNLGGTFRTLDRIDGRCELDNGILSEYGLSILDDSGSMLFTEDGWVAPRDKSKADVYLFAYGVDYREALKTFFTVSGAPPLIPRWSLGNWWSRYYSYSDKEYLAMMDRFKQDDIPLSVAVLDIGWHPINVPAEYGTGWTGYTWDKQLFPDHVSFLSELHKRDLKTTLNVHPADGIRSYEKPYAEMCTMFDRDASKKVPVPFECANKDFFKAYFEKLHHPLEDEGVDFWWIDWQQGPHSEIEGVDPLWMLNHYHYLDSGRKGQRRFTFSRYAGPGSHRYPIGFSGDTVISWASLAFQPEFTATASNIGYGHWSHDIGGHYHGVKDDELMARWVQSGCFSPFLRLHSSISPFNTREPWAFNRECHDVCRQYLQFRHRLVPYLYSAAVNASRDLKSLVEPMYYDHPNTPEAYAYKSQYTFGTELLVVPVVAPRDKASALGKATGWLPKGKWVDIFDETIYTGDRVLTFHRPLDAYPVFAKQGAILPLDGKSGAGLDNGCPVPESIEIWLVVGADGSFDLVEDDGSGATISDVEFATTPIRYTHGDGVLTIGPCTGTLLEARSYSVRLLACDVSDFSLKVDGASVDLSFANGIINLGKHATTATIALTLGQGNSSASPSDASPCLAKQDHRQRIFDRLSAAQMEIDMKGVVWDAVQTVGDRGVLHALSKIRATGAEPEIMSIVEELLLADVD